MAALQRAAQLQAGQELYPDKVDNLIKT